MQINIGLTETIRQQMAQNLSLLLADTYVLYVKTQNFHWNLIDPRFYSIHLFLEKEYEQLADGIDEIAERIRQLGERSPGSLQQFLSMTSFTESDANLTLEEMLAELLKNHEMICRFLRDRIALANKLRDDGTADLLIERLRAHEKSAWMLRSQAFSNTV